MEVWKQIIIDGEEWNYEVSSHGRVRNSKTQQIIRFTKMKKGYLRVGLWKHNKQKMFLVHRLVALMFIGDSSLEVNHIDEDKTNNRVENLEFVTHKVNMNHGTQVQRMSQALSKPVYYVENGVAIVYPSIKATELDGFNKNCVCQCCNGRQKTHKGKEWHYVA